MLNEGQWFPQTGSSQVVGRFIERSVESASASVAAGKSTYVTRVFMESKVAGQADVSSRVVKPFNEKELRAEFPGAWEHFEKVREASAARQHIQADHVPERAPGLGTPLSAVDFLPRDKIAWLSDLGFSSVEQIADMSDAQVQSVGRGAASWRKQAQGWLKRT